MSTRRIDGELISQVEDEDCPKPYKFPRRVEGSDNLWERFAILPNIQGQTYSIGDLFEAGGGEEQGEFIFYQVHIPSPFVSIQQTVLCEITVEKNNYCITSCQDNDIWINGLQIEKRKNMTLNFGDYLHLGVKAEFGDAGYKSGLWFKERDLDPKAFTEDDRRLKLKKRDKDTNSLNSTIEFTPGNNELVLSNILSYLHLRDLKQARLVSKLWNEEARKIIKKRYFVQFHLSSYKEASGSMALFRYVQDMKNTQMTRWKISLFGIAQLPAKLDQDLDWFLPQGHNVKKLRLLASMFSAVDFERNIKILAQLQPTLQDLGLNWLLSPKARISEEDYQLLSTIRFKKLQKFTLSMKPPGSWNQLADISPLLQHLVQAIRNVSTIRMNTTPQICSLLLEHIKKSSPYPNLVAHEISFDRSDGEEVHNPEDLKCIMELDKPLTSLRLAAHNLTDRDNAHHIEALFLKHAPTLQYLHFKIIPSDHPGTINLPAFPNLKELIVGVHDYNQTHLKQYCTLKFLDENELVEYAKHFPSLQSLTFIPIANGPCWVWEWQEPPKRKKLINRWEKHWDFLKVFFPIRQQNQSPQQICKSLQYLQIPYNYYRHLLPRTREIATIFPNVFNKWMNKARKQLRKRLPPTQMKLRSSATRL